MKDQLQNQNNCWFLQMFTQPRPETSGTSSARSPQEILLLWKRDAPLRLFQTEYKYFDLSSCWQSTDMSTNTNKCTNKSCFISYRNFKVLNLWGLGSAEDFPMILCFWDENVCSAPLKPLLLWFWWVTPPAPNHLTEGWSYCKAASVHTYKSTSTQ